MSENLALYDALVAENPNFERKGKTMPYTSANGYMFSLLNKEDQFGIRLSKEDQELFCKQYDSGPYFSHGATMRDYVHVPDQLLRKPKELGPLLQKSFDFVMSLPPK